MGASFGCASSVTVRLTAWVIRREPAPGLRFPCPRPGFTAQAGSDYRPRPCYLCLSPQLLLYAADVIPTPPTPFSYYTESLLDPT
jgi:hypothetical protein